MWTADFICAPYKRDNTCMSLLLDASEVRVLGALMEKEATTPEYYPLSLNALVNACNQKSNRDPVVSYDDDTVMDALDRLREKRCSLTITGNGRVHKYQQRISETLNLGRRESAVLCVLLLRGAQTLGEIKDRSERMHSFADLAEAEGTLDKLATWPGGPLVSKLPRQAGQKEQRYTHLLAGEPDLQALAESVSHALNPSTRVEKLEQELMALRAEFDELKSRFDQLESQLR
jgi:uncharacterized protein YceH (UPF0502 family)